MNSKVNAIDLSAKLLATENISVRRARSRTASFDIKSRVLTIPMWKDMTPEVEGMLVGHEVGHALWTGDEYMEPIKENPKMHSYLNVLEDVRIEKLLKRKYPGIRKTMNEGYKQLNEKDFFGVGKTDLSMINLIDRINLYYKAGYSCGVQFTSEEKPFVVRAEKTETIDEVVALAKEIYEYSLEQAKKNAGQRMLEEQLEREEDDEESGEYDDLDEIDEDFDNIDDSDMDKTGETQDEADFESEEKKQPSLGKTKTEEEKKQEIVDKEMESVTDKTLEEKLAELADESTEFHYHQLDSDYVVDHIIGYKKILSDVAETFANMEHNVKSIDDFKPDSSRIVNYLIKEFEMKKSATMYKRAKTSKMGSLDMKKVWSYKLNSDLFKRVTTFPQGKNHGMIFLLDWSGSMDPMLDDTIKQVVTLAMFCQRAQIPYQVFAFTSQYDIFSNYTDAYTKMRAKQQAIYATEDSKVLNNAVNNFALLELFSNKMSNVEFNTMCKYVMDRWFRYTKNGEYGTGGTPLNEALAYMVDYIPKFIKAHNVEKMSFITLTDGEGSALYPVYRQSLDSVRNERVVDEKTGEYKYNRIQMKHFLQDTMTKKSYELPKHGNGQSEVLLRVIKDRYNVNSVGFYICPNTRRYLCQAVRANLPGFAGSEYNLVDVWRKEFRDNGFASVKNTGRDDLFIIPQNRLAVENEKLEILANQTAKQISNKFSKMMSSKKTSRVLLNKFIGYVA
jgi:uncharacterized protein with von Willebrand factor type A (vWA) domain